MGHCINSVISQPLAGQNIKVYAEKPRIVLKGVAVGSGHHGGRVTKVEVSFDNGKTWKEAKITQREKKDEDKKVFSWVQWKYVLPIDPKEKNKKMSVMVRCEDSSGANQ